MSVSDSPIRLDDLLAHHAWVRTLARALVRDENEADDVEQQTWLAAAGGGPSDPAAARGWLGAVVRNVVRKRHRSRERRLRREIGAATAEAVTSGDPAELAARAELHSRVAAAVVALRQPYRDAILLRYFGEHPVAEVARRAGVPRETTRAHLRRGREMLRARLGRELGGEGRLALALAPLVGRSRDFSAGAAGALGGGVMVMKTVAAGALALALVGGGVWIAAGRGGTEAQVAMAPDASETAAAAVDPAVSPSEPDRTRRRTTRALDDTPAPPVEARDASADAQAGGPDLAELLAATVPDTSFDGEPMMRALALLSGVTRVPVHVDAAVAADLERVPVTLQMEGVSAQSFFATMGMVCGDLTLAVEEDRVVLHRRGDAWRPEMATVAVVPIAPDPDAPTSYVVRGRVLDQEGRSVPDVEIVDGLDVLARTDQSGRYSFEGKRRSIEMRAVLPLHGRSRPARLQAKYGETYDHDFTLGPPTGAIEVTVRGPSGAALPELKAGFEWSVPAEDGGHRSDSFWTLSDEHGVLRCDVAHPGEVALRIADSSYAPVRETFVAREGVVTKLDLELRRTTLRERLTDELVTCSFKDAGVVDVAAYLSHVKSVQVIVDPSVTAALPGATVTVEAADVTIAALLDELCGQLEGVTYAVQDNCVLITAKTE